MKGNVTILVSVLTMLLVATGVGAGTMAWFSQSENAAITITAGNVDLQLAKPGGDWSNGLSFNFPVGFAPGDSYTIDVYLRNMGSSGSKTVWIYGNGLGGNTDLAQQIYISEVTFTDSIVYSPSGWTTPPMSNYIPRFGDGVGQLTVNDFTATNGAGGQYMRFYWGKWFTQDYLQAGGASVQEVKMTFTFAETAPDTLQNTVCSFNIVFLATDNQGYDLIWPLS